MHNYSSNSGYCSWEELKPYHTWISLLKRPIETREACNLLRKTHKINANPGHIRLLLNPTAMEPDLPAQIAAIDAAQAVDAHASRTSMETQSADVLGSTMQQEPTDETSFLSPRSDMYPFLLRWRQLKRNMTPLGLSIMLF